MDESSLFESKEFQSIDKEKLAVMKELARMSKGKGPMEILDLFNKYGGKLSGGKPLLENEKTALLQVMRQSMDPQERAGFDKMLGMLRMMGKI